MYPESDIEAVATITQFIKREPLKEPRSHLFKLSYKEYAVLVIFVAHKRGIISTLGPLDDASTQDSS